MSGSAAVSLLESLQRIIERTYGMSTGIFDVGSFVLGDDGYRRFYAGGMVLEKVHQAGTTAGAGPRLLLRYGADGASLRAAIYYPDDLVQRLEDRHPLRGLSDVNIDDFAAFVEELDHLLCVADRVRESRPFSLLELELHANVTKYLASALFLGLPRSGRPLGSSERLWLRYHLFEKREFTDADPQVRGRYRDAARFAWRFLGAIEPLTGWGRIEELRRFHRLTHQQKLACLS